MASSSLSLTKPTTADTLSFFLDAHNKNAAALEARVPEPVVSGSTGTMYYRLWPDGTAEAWGRVHVAAANSQVGGSDGSLQYVGGYVSEIFGFSWPVQFLSTAPILVVSCRSNKYADITLLTTKNSVTGYEGRFYAPFAEEPGKWKGVSDKDVDFLARGFWR